MLFYDSFGITSSDIMREDTGLNGYNVRYSFRNIYIMINSNRPDMGVNILLTGHGCRDFENLDLSWHDFFLKLSKFDFNFNRIDIAIDLFTSQYFNFKLLNYYLDIGLCVSKFKKTFHLYQQDIKDTSLLSETIQFGSKASDVEITFYDKYKERNNAGYTVDNNITFWLRTELRFRHSKALEVFKNLTENEDYSSYIMGVLYNYIDFKTFNSSNNQVSRRPTVQWWLRFIGDVSKIKLCTRSSDRTITQKYNWLLNSTSKTQLMCYFADLPNIKLDNLSIDLLFKLLVNGSKNIKQKDIVLINDYRISKGLPLIDSKVILDYIDDLNNSYIVD